MQSNILSNSRFQARGAADDLFESHNTLAKAIALEYLNIPSVDVSECISIAQQALWRAANSFNSDKGRFSSFASKSIRNALNSLYAKQLKVSKIFPESLDASPNWPHLKDAYSDSDASAIFDPKESVHAKVRLGETKTFLHDVMRALTPREYIVIEYIKNGNSFSEIGNLLGISKQAAHKIANNALEKLRLHLEATGFSGIDSYGLLKEQSETSVG
jgi:RNA polymerase sigma factor (sigma-70 family)